MKLKQALKKAKRFGYRWIAVDPCSTIYAYKNKPKVGSCGGVFTALGDCYQIGNYTGGKLWNITRREVPE